MTWFSLIEYWKYLWRAQRRHGVHSPLVYGLVDIGLKNPVPIEKLQIFYKNDDGANWNSTELMAKIVAHFGFAEVRRWEQDSAFSSFKNGTIKDQFPCNICYDFSKDSPADALNFLQKCGSELSEHDALCVGQIHRSKESQASWRTLQNQPQVTLTLDFYSLGILIFSKKIKERQHFILRS